jgi:hypothetical protein
MACLLTNIPLFMLVAATWIKITIKYEIDWTNASVSYWTCLIISSFLLFIFTLASLRIADTKMIIAVFAESVILTSIFIFLSGIYLAGFP